MSGTDGAQPGATWTPPQTPCTPGTPIMPPQEDRSEDNNSVGKTTAVALENRFVLGDISNVDSDSVGETTVVTLGESMVGNTTILSVGHGDEDPIVVMGDLEGKTDRTPLNTEIRRKHMNENTPRIPLDLLDKDHKDPRTTSSPTTSTPGNTPKGSGSNELRESELQSSEQSAIEISGMMMDGERKGDIVDDKVIYKMINTSIYGDSEGEDDSQAVDETAWETTCEDSNLQDSEASSCVAQRTRSNRDLRRMNLTELLVTMSTTMEESFEVIGNNANDSLDLHRPESNWENKNEWCGKLQLLDTSLDKITKIGGTQRQKEMVKIFDKKTEEIAKKNEELRQMKEGKVEKSNRGGEVKKVTFVVKEPAYTNAMKEVVRALETLVELDLQTAPLRNVENIMRIILYICMDYSTQIQTIQETMESMARLIKELMVLRGRLMDLELENSILREEKVEAERNVLRLTRYNEVLDSLSTSLVGGDRGRDVVTSIVKCNEKIDGLKEAAREREEKYTLMFERKEHHKLISGNLEIEVAKLKEENKKINSVSQSKDTQMDQMMSKYELEEMKVDDLKKRMEGMELTHKEELAAKVEEQAVKSEEVNDRRLKAEIKAIDAGEELKKVRRDLNSLLRSKDEEIKMKEAEIARGKDSLAKEEEVNNEKKAEIEILEQELDLTKKGLEAFTYYCTLFWKENPKEVFDPTNPEKRFKPPQAPKPKRNEEKVEDAGSLVNTSREDSCAVLDSSTAGVWGDTSNLDLTCGQNSTGVQASGHKGEKRRRVEIGSTRKIEKNTEINKSDTSSEESPSPSISVSGDDKEHSKRKKYGKNRNDREKNMKEEQNRLINEMKEEHQKHLEEQRTRNKEELDKLKKEMEQKSQQELENLKKELGVRGIMVQEPIPKEATEEEEGAVGGVQDPALTAQKSAGETTNPNLQKSENQAQPSHTDPTNQNREEGSPLIIAVTEDNKGKVSNQYKGLMVNEDGSLNMTPQFHTWASNQDIQMQKMFKVAPTFPAGVIKTGHPEVTRQNLAWNHDGEWILVPVDRLDEGPEYRDSLVARIERAIDVDGNIRRALSYGDEDTKLKAWFDLEEMKVAFPNWIIPNPSKFYNGRRFNAEPRKQKDAGRPIKGKKGRNQNPFWDKGNQYKGRPETYLEWDKQQFGGSGNHRSNQEQKSWEQKSWDQYQQQQQHQQHQHQHQLQNQPQPQPHYHQQLTSAVTPALPIHYPPAVTPALPIQQHHPQHQTPAVTPTLQSQQHQQQHPSATPLPPNDQHQYTRSRDYQSWDQPWDQQTEDPQHGHSRDPRDYSRGRQGPRDRHQTQEGYQTKEFEDKRRRESRERRSRDASRNRYREASRERHGDRRQRRSSMSPRRRSNRSPSPSGSGIGRGGGNRNRERDHGEWHDNGRGRGSHDKRGSDASYGGS